MLMSMLNGSSKPAAIATCAHVSSLVATVCSLVLEKILSLSSSVAALREEGSAAIWTASLFEPLLYWAMLCPSSLGGTKSAKDEGGNEETDLGGPDDAEVTNGNEGTEFLEGTDANDVTKDDFEETALHEVTNGDCEATDLHEVGSPFTIAGPSFSGRGRTCLGDGVADACGRTRECRAGMHSTVWIEGPIIPAAAVIQPRSFT